MVVTMYTDRLVSIGYITEEWWDEFTMRHGNTIDIDVPEDILRKYYKAKLQPDYKCSFKHWLYEESIADDMDDLFASTDWRPTNADIIKWY